MYKILLGTPCIDRDAHLLCKSDLKSAAYQVDQVIVCRETDEKVINWCKENLATCITVPDYKIEKRHNVQHIAEKRNMIFRRALDNDYDYVLFLDSDVRPYDGFLDEMLKIDKDVVCGLYAVRWLDNKPYCLTSNGIKEHKELTAGDKIIVAGFGCCLIKKKCLGVKIERLYRETEEFYFDGEDFGWFLSIVDKYEVAVLSKVVEHQL